MKTLKSFIVEGKAEVKATKQASGYLPPTEAPFKCGACKFFGKPNKCILVEGEIEENACCNLFQKRI